VLNEERPRRGDAGAVLRFVRRASHQHVSRRCSLPPTCRTDQVLPAPDQSHGEPHPLEKVPVLAVANVPSRRPVRDAPRGYGAPKALLTWVSPELSSYVATELAGRLLVSPSPATRSGRWGSPSIGVRSDQPGRAWACNGHTSPLTCTRATTRARCAPACGLAGLSTSSEGEPHPRPTTCPSRRAHPNPSPLRGGLVQGGAPGPRRATHRTALITTTSSPKRRPELVAGARLRGHDAGVPGPDHRPQPRRRLVAGDGEAGPGGPGIAAAAGGRLGTITDNPSAGASC